MKPLPPSPRGPQCPPAAVLEALSAGESVPEATRAHTAACPDCSAQLQVHEQRGQGSGEDADRRALLGGALRQLDEKTRTIGVLHFLDGYTQEEVAEQTGYSRKTVGKKLQLFEARVRELWQSARRPQAETYKEMR